MPGRWAAPPAAAMMTLIPRSAAAMATSPILTGVRLALGLDTLMSHISSQLHQRLGKLLQLLDAGVQSGESDVADLAAGLGLLAVEVSVDAGLASEHGLGLVDERKMGFGLGASEDIDHDAGGDVGL
ncbi:hypothetical protein HG530_007797 [Fusarium avenaceum]|nr:hypothetical protein HG530_007797 [Fusarium avenaceum]